LKLTVKFVLKSL